MFIIKSAIGSVGIHMHILRRLNDNSNHTVVRLTIERLTTTPLGVTSERYG